MTVLVVILAVVVALLALLVAGLLRSHAEILRALHELGVNLDPRRPTDAASPAPGLPPRTAGRAASDLAGVTPGRDAISIGVVGAQQSSLLAFLTSGCTTCSGFWEAFRESDRLDIPGGARPVVVTKADGEESISQIRKLAPRDVPVVMSNDAWRDYDVPVAPYFVYVDGPSGQVVGEGAASSWDHVRSLMSQALEDAGVVDGRGRRRRSRSGAARQARADRELSAAGIQPGDPSLYPRSVEDLLQSEDDER